MKPPAAPEALRRLFDVIVREAEKNPVLAQELIEAVAEPLARLTPAEKSRPERRRPFDAAGVHAINILRSHGEAALRGRLEQIRAVEDLKAVAKASGLVLPGSAGGARPSRLDLIDGIIAAAKHYDALRSAAAS
jgi:hypothetical protein